MSLISLKTGSSYNLKILLKYKNIILPVLGILVIMICLVFIFSVLLGSTGGE